MIIRPYQGVDEDELVKVWYDTTIIAHHFIAADIWSEHKQLLRNKYLPMAKTWVAEENSKLVGFISLLEDHIGGLFVLPQYQGQKIGTKLVEHAKRLRGNLSVDVYNKNEEARKFYEKLGFVYVEEQIGRAHV